MPNLIAIDGVDLGPVDAYAESEGQVGFGRNRLRGADRCAFYLLSEELAGAAWRALNDNVPIRLVFEDGRERSLAVSKIEEEFSPVRRSLVSGELGPRKE